MPVSDRAMRTEFSGVPLSGATEGLGASSKGMQIQITDLQRVLQECHAQGYASSSAKSV